MQTILVPTDFKLSSLDCIPSLCEQTDGKDISLVFMHMFKLSDSIGDLLMLSRRSKEYEHVSDEFYQRCEALKAEFPQIKSLKIDFFYGNTLIMFRNYLEAHCIDEVLDLNLCSTDSLNKSSLDPAMLIKKCGLSTLKINPMRPMRPVQVTTPERLEVLEEELLKEA